MIFNDLDTGVWDGKNPEVFTAFECLSTNPFDTGGEEHGIERMTCNKSMCSDDLD
eukprot:CAMPEP_0204614376 /NCGR_PEP_ID=MMETSP0717-20131115/2112_1 /ASSEMBLY_ACC=CAM_ASM_000666 /TAXON_ID=230516 /ORGANISM="Chaetoceros curvisetus" /LENGTH=54 /DNA_ID=CAMNT_0051627027 /DNA_START=719 /DNA_END=880 /DNA_ORIENTATION=+